MPDNDDYGFWDGDGRRDHTGPIPRLKRPASPRAPSPRTGAPSPRTVALRLADGRSGTRPSNPLTRRLGALCGLALLAIPVALMMRGPGNDEKISTADAAAVDPALAVVDPVVPAAALPTPAPVITAAPIVTAAVVVTAAPTTAVPTTATPTTEAPATTSAAPAPSASVAARVETAGTARPVGVGTPVVETKRSCAIDYTVAAGDYWISIAKASSVKLATLLSVNGAKVSTPLFPGRTICLPANASAPATTTATTTKATTPTTAKATPITTATTVKATATTTKPKPTTTTVPPTTAAPATTAAPPANRYSRAEVEQIIRNVWPDDVEDEAVRIATRESNLIPTVRNSCCYGLFQIYFNANKSSLTSWGITSASALYDPQVNAYAAYAMYLRAGGWGPWAM